jgi:hypothetical protein
MVWFRKKSAGTKARHPELRKLLLCDQSLAQLGSEPSDDPDTPQARFHAAQSSMLVGDRAHARRQLHDLLTLPAIDTSWRLQAWRCLRDLDELPSPAQGAVVRGVVVDIGTPKGLETIAVYEDHTACLLRADGEVLSFTDPEPGIADPAEALLAAARGVVQHTHPHAGPAENPPEAGHACIRVLTYAGTHTGLGPVHSLERDAVGGPVLRAATALGTAMQSLRLQRAQ